MQPLERLPPPAAEYRYPADFPSGGEPPSGEPTRRRLLVFAISFLLAAVAGLGYTFLRPAVYQSTAVLLIDPPPGQTAGALPGPHIAVERQLLLGRELLIEVWQRLITDDTPLPGGLTGAADLAGALRVETVDGSNLLKLHAQGGEPQRLAPLVDAWTAAYLARRAANQNNAFDTQQTALRDRLQELRARIEAKRGQLAEFRRRHQIVSAERDENQVSAQLKSLNQALSKAASEQASAEARYNTLTRALARGEPITRPQDDRVAADLAQRARELREQLQAVSRRFTAEYMRLDPDVVAMRANLERLEGRLSRRQQEIGRSAVRDAERALLSARETVAGIRQQLADYQRQADGFNSTFSEYQALQEELAQLEQAYRDQQQGLLKIEVTEPQPEPEVLERPYPADAPLYPDYRRDAGLSLAVAALFGLFGVLLYELFTRPAARTPQPYPLPVPYPAAGLTAQVGYGPALATVETAALTQPLRELSAAEIDALLAAADDQGRLAVGLLLSGLSAAEVTALNWQDIDRTLGVLYVSGSDGRSIPLSPGLKTALARFRPLTGDPVLCGPQGRLGAGDLATLLRRAAAGAGLGTDVTADRLRHTYLVYLAKQGVRPAELMRLAGRLAPQTLADYQALAATQPGRTLEQTDVIYPALR